jgi:hypothetical protein
VLAFRETAHGCKVVFDDGHLVEFAVFEPDEIPVARVNRYRVLFDRESIEERVAAVAAATKERAESARPSAEWLAGQFLTSLLVGAERDLRGERLSGRELVKDRAVRHLIGLFEADGRESPHAVDSLDPLRRFEQAFRNRGERINAILEEPTPLAARLLLDLAVAELPGRLPPRAVDAVRRRLSD